MLPQRIFAPAGVLAGQGQAQDYGIAGDDARAVPEGKAELPIEQAEEMIIEPREGGSRNQHPGFGKG